MDRRTFIKTSALLPAAAASLPRLAKAAAELPESSKWRVFEVTTRIAVPKAVGPARAWLPLPLSSDTDYQKSLGNSWSGNPAVARIDTDAKYGAALFYAEWAQDENAPVVELTSRFATRNRAVNLAKAANAQTIDRAALAPYLEATELIPTDGIVRAKARDIIKGVSGGDLEKARALYDWVVENTFRDPKVQGCGRGDIRFMLESGHLSGKCADLNTLFVGLARAVGIPARDVYGVRVADSAAGFKSLGRSGDITKAQHCRAEFYAAGYGWVPVDPGDVRKVALEEAPGNLALEHPQVQKARALLFGSWEMNWLAFNYAHDVSMPQSAHGKLPFFMYPQLETAEGRRNCLDPANFAYQITSRELTSA